MPINWKNEDSFFKKEINVLLVGKTLSKTDLIKITMPPNLNLGETLMTTQERVAASKGFKPESRKSLRSNKNQTALRQFNRVYRLKNSDFSLLINKRNFENIPANNLTRAIPGLENVITFLNTPVLNALGMAITLIGASVSLYPTLLNFFSAVKEKFYQTLESNGFLVQELERNAKEGDIFVTACTNASLRMSTQRPEPTGTDDREELTLSLGNCICGWVKKRRGLSKYDLFLLVDKDLEFSEDLLDFVMGETIFGSLAISWPGDDDTNRVEKFWGKVANTALDKRKIYELCLQTEVEILDQSDPESKIPEGYKFLHIYLIEAP